MEPVVEAIHEELSDGEWHGHDELFGVGRRAESDLVDKTIHNILYKMWEAGLVRRKGPRGIKSYKLR